MSDIITSYTHVQIASEDGTRELNASTACLRSVERMYQSQKSSRDAMHAAGE